jgi:hypothetical protein
MSEYLKVVHFCPNHCCSSRAIIYTATPNPGFSGTQSRSAS